MPRNPMLVRREGIYLDKICKAIPKPEISSQDIGTYLTSTGLEKRETAFLQSVECIERGQAVCKSEHLQKKLGGLGKGDLQAGVLFLKAFYFDTEGHCGQEGGRHRAAVRGQASEHGGQGEAGQAEDCHGQQGQQGGHQR